MRSEQCRSKEHKARYGKERKGPSHSPRVEWPDECHPGHRRCEHKDADVNALILGERSGERKYAAKEGQRKTVHEAQA
jgi:hypothetical protein